MRRDKLTLDQQLNIIRRTADPIKKLAADNKAVGVLYDLANTISLNANDTFGYACAESVDIMIEDLPMLLEVQEKFGYDGVNAFMALVTEQEVLKELQSEKYFEAAEYLHDYEPCTWING